VQRFDGYKRRGADKGGDGPGLPLCPAVLQKMSDAFDGEMKMAEYCYPPGGGDAENVPKSGLFLLTGPSKSVCVESVPNNSRVSRTCSSRLLHS